MPGGVCVCVEGSGGMKGFGRYLHNQDNMSIQKYLCGGIFCRFLNILNTKIISSNEHTVLYSHNKHCHLNDTLKIQYK